MQRNTKVLSCRSLGMSAKERLYERVAVVIALYGGETWNKGVALKRLKVRDDVRVTCWKSH